MPVETQVALIGAVATILLGLVPIAVQYMRAKGLQISQTQEQLIRDAVSEGARFAEEIARKQPATSSEKLAIASTFAQDLLKRRGVKVGLSDIQERVEANVEVALPHRGPPSRLEMPPTLRGKN